MAGTALKRLMAEYKRESPNSGGKAWNVSTQARLTVLRASGPDSLFICPVKRGGGEWEAVFPAASDALRRDFIFNY